MRTPRAFLVSVLTTIVLAVQYLAGDLAAYESLKHSFLGSEWLDEIVLRQLSPFYGSVFGLSTYDDEVRTDLLVNFLTAMALALVVAWLLIWWVSRSGSVSAMFGTWFAVMAATALGSVLSGLMFANSVDLGTGRPHLVSGTTEHGLHWGFIFGWLPALVAAMAAAMFRKPAPYAGGPGESDGQQIPVRHQPFDYLPGSPQHQGAQPGPQQGQHGQPPYGS